MGSTENVQKLGVGAEIFLLKALEGVLHQWWKLSLTELVFAETSTQTYSLSEEGFGYNYGRLKKLSEPRISWKYLAKMWKKSEMSSPFAAILAQAYENLLRVSIYCLSIA